MSEDEREIDIESEDEDGNSRSGRHGSGGDNPSTDKRAHHNALERKRRDHIKDSFSSLRDAIPTMQGDKSSRAQILKKASDYITFMRRKNQNHQQDIEDLKRQNSHLEKQIRTLERAKSSGNYN
jgi:Max protein